MSILDQHAAGFRNVRIDEQEHGHCGHCGCLRYLVIVSPCGDPMCCTTGYCQSCADDLGLGEVR